MKMRKLFTLLLAAALAVTMLFPASAFAGATTAPTPTLDEGTSLKWEIGYMQEGMSWGTMPTPPIVAGGAIYYGSKRTIYKVDAETGKVLATSPVLRSHFGYATIQLTVDDFEDPHYVYGFLDNCRFVRLNASDLSRPTGWVDSEEDFSHQDSAQGNCYTVCHNGRLYSGTWLPETVRDPSTNKVIGTIYYGDFVCVDAETGKTIWKVCNTGDNCGYYWTGAAFINTPGGERVIFGGDDGILYSVASDAVQEDFGADNGKVKSLQLGQGIRTIPAVDQENMKIYVPTNDEVSAVSEGGKGSLFSIAVADDGSLSILQSYESLGSSKNAPVLSGDHLFVTGYGGNIFAFNKADIAQPEWKVKAPSEIKGQLLVASDSDKIRIYGGVYALPGGIYCVETDKECKSHTEGMIFTPAHWEYGISPIVCDDSGTLFYKNDSGYVMAVKNGQDLSAVKNVKAKVTSYNSAALTWDYKANVKEYQVQQKKGTAYTTIATVSGDSYRKSNATYTASKLDPGVNHSFRIIAVMNNGEESAASAAVSAKPVLAKAKLTAKAGKKKITLSWKKIAGADGYTIYRATKKAGKYKAIKTITKAKTVTFTNKKLKKGKKYFYKIKAYHTVNGKKVYGPFSNIAYKKVK